MKKSVFTIIFLLFISFAFSQSNSTKELFLKLSGGRVNFGTGDILGYSILIEAGKNVKKKPSFALSKLLIGGELIFEQGVRNPVVEDPTGGQFFSQTFYHVSNTNLWPKISYYPFNKIIKGFNIQLGPTIGYAYRSEEKRASRIVDPGGTSTRTSTLGFNNGFTVGYRISTGIEFNIGKKMLTGLRLDFSNNNEAEINTLAGLKIGIRL
jgi:hypothetical protein